MGFWRWLISREMLDNVLIMTGLIGGWAVFLCSLIFGFANHLIWIGMPIGILMFLWGIYCVEGDN